MYVFSDQKSGDNKKDVNTDKSPAERMLQSVMKKNNGKNCNGTQPVDVISITCNLFSHYSPKCWLGSATGISRDCAKVTLGGKIEIMATKPIRKK